MEERLSGGVAMSFIYTVDLEPLDQLRLGVNATAAHYRVESDIVRVCSPGDDLEDDGTGIFLVQDWDVFGSLEDARGNLGMEYDLNKHPQRKELIRIFNRFMKATGRKVRVKGEMFVLDEKVKTILLTLG